MAPQLGPETAGAMGKAKGAFTRKLGPLPVWAWGGIFGGAILGYRYFAGPKTKADPAAAGAPGGDVMAPLGPVAGQIPAPFGGGISNPPEALPPVVGTAATDTGSATPINITVAAPDIPADSSNSAPPGHVARKPPAKHKAKPKRHPLARKPRKPKAPVHGHEHPVTHPKPSTLHLPHRKPPPRPPIAKHLPKRGRAAAVPAPKPNPAPSYSAPVAHAAPPGRHAPAHPAKPPPKKRR